MRFDVWREDDNGVRVFVGSCFTRVRSADVVETFERRGHKQRYWIEECEGPGTNVVVGVPELGLFGRVVAPRVTLSTIDGWRQTHPFKWERVDASVAALLHAIEFDTRVPFEAFVDHHWRQTVLGYRQYRREELIVDRFAGCEALGYDWGTGVSEIVAWHIRASDRVLLWAACESFIAENGEPGPPPDAMGRALFAGLRI